MEITISEPVAEKVLDSCMGVDNRRYYKVQWQATWEPEDEILAKYHNLVEDFWKDTETNDIEAGRTFINTLFEKLNQPELDADPTKTKTAVNSPEHKIADDPPPANDRANKPAPLFPWNKKGTSEIRPYKCDECIRSYPTEKKLKDHKRKLHTNLGTYQCSVCPKIFTTKRNLQNHMNRHTGVGPHQCPGCTKRFMTPLELENHKRSCNNLVDKDHQCEICSKRFTTKTHLAFHQKIHLPDSEKPYKCQYCPRTFAYNHDCVHHMRLHIGEKPFKCQHCDAAFHRKSYLTEHMFLHTGISKYRCEECLEYFKTQQMLQTHVKNIHILKKAPLTEEEKLKKKSKKKKKNIRYKCEECGKEFRFMKEFHYHQVINHKEATEQKEGLEFSEFEPTMVYKCKKCEKTFTWPSALKKHAETHRYDDLVDKYIEVVEVKKDAKGKNLKGKKKEAKENDATPENKENEEQATSLAVHKDSDVTSSGQKIVVLLSQIEGDVSEAGDEKNEDVSEDNMFTCGHCYSTFDNEISLNVHMLEKHQNQRELTDQEKNLIQAVANAQVEGEMDAAQDEVMDSDEEDMEEGEEEEIQDVDFDQDITSEEQAVEENSATADTLLQMNSADPTSLDYIGQL